MTLESTERPRHKIILVGDAAVGKTSLKSTYLGLDYLDRYTMTLGADYGVKLFEKHVLHIFDIGGQQVFKNVVEDYFKGAKGAVLVFDITRPETLDNIPRWVNLISTKIGHMIPAVLVGNKSDLRQKYSTQVSLDTAFKMAEKLSNETIYEIPYFETSAKTGLNVDYLFEHLVATMNALYH